MIQSWNRFWLTPASPRPLGVLRIGVALILLIQAFSVAPHFFEIYGSEGILEGTLRSQFVGSNVPGIYELGQFVVSLGFTERGLLSTIGSLYLTSLFFLLFGFHTRLASIAVYVTSLLLTSGHVSSYGLDTFVNIVLFYFLFFPIGRAYSLDVVTQRLSPVDSSEARVSLRMLQLHLSIAYFFCGIDKAMGIQWWNGDAIWRSLMLPVYAHGDFSWLANYPWIPKLAGWGTVVVETLYPLGMWVPKLRKPMLVAIIGLHLGIFLFLGLHLFALIMIWLSFSAFGVKSSHQIVPILHSKMDRLKSGEPSLPIL